MFMTSPFIDPAFSPPSSPLGCFSATPRGGRCHWRWPDVEGRRGEVDWIQRPHQLT